MGLMRRLSNPLKIRWEHSAPPSATDLRPGIKDAVFHYQRRGDDFVRIDAGTLLVAEICGTLAFGAKVLAACEKTGIVDAATGYPNTNKIDRSIVAAMPHISLPKQRELVMLLFHHEQEIYRYRLLCVEEQEILDAMSRDTLTDLDRVELLNRLKEVEAQKWVVPSRRDGRAKSSRQSVISGSSIGSSLPSCEEEKGEMAA